MALDPKVQAIIEILLKARQPCELETLLGKPAEHPQRVPALVAKPALHSLSPFLGERVMRWIDDEV